MPHRNAVSVLPEPVGARISVWSPLAMAGQPLSWASVGAGNEDSNQARTGAEKRSSAMGAMYGTGVTFAAAPGCRVGLPAPGQPVKRARAGTGVAAGARGVAGTDELEDGVGADVGGGASAQSFGAGCPSNRSSIHSSMAGNDGAMTPEWLRSG